MIELRIIFIGWLVVAVSMAFVLNRHKQTRVVRACPPYDQCTPKGDWNHPDCKCWSL